MYLQIDYKNRTLRLTHSGQGRTFHLDEVEEFVRKNFPAVLSRHLIKVTLNGRLKPVHDWQAIFLDKRVACLFLVTRPDTIARLNNQVKLAEYFVTKQS